MAEEQNDAPYTETDPDAPIRLSTVESYTRTTTTEWNTSFRELIAQFSERPEYSPVKEGRAYLIGNCLGSRRDANMQSAGIAVLDADSSILPDGTTVSGAPEPKRIHEALVACGISHLIHTTFSHGSGKGNRYRVLFPSSSSSKIELTALLTHIVHLLQSQHDLPIALTRESLTWTQPWQMPKVSGDRAPYESYSFVGWQFNTRQLAFAVGLTDRHGSPVSVTMPPALNYEDGEGEVLELFRDVVEEVPSVIREFNRTFSSLSWLEMAGYTFEGQQPVVDPHGEPQIVLRYKRPGSLSTPGVVAFVDQSNVLKDGESNYCIFSHHGEDPLNNGHANDSFAVFSLLNNLSKARALQVAAGMLEKAFCDDLNLNYPSVIDGRHPAVYMRETLHGSVAYRAMTWPSFCFKFENHPLIPTVTRHKETGDIQVQYQRVIDYWKKSPKRITFDGTVFWPYPLVEEKNRPEGLARHVIKQGERSYFNTFHGWGIEPYQGAWPLFREHLLYAVCGGIQQEYDYLLNWLAHLFQFPAEKPGVAVVLSGKKGWGKSLLFQFLAKAMGESAIILANNRQLTGQFSGHLQQCLLAVVEESFWAGDKQHEGILKHLVTDEKTTFEAKGKDATSGTSYCRVALITNDAWAVPASSDERRYFLPSMCAYSYERDIRNGQKGYFFPQLVSELKNGGVAAFAHDMLYRDLSNCSLVTVPETHRLQQQKMLSMTPMESWLYDLLLLGKMQTPDSRIISLSSGASYIPLKDVADSVSDSLPANEKKRMSMIRIQMFLDDVLEGAVSFGNGNIVFASLQACREKYIESMRLSPNLFDSGASTEIQYQGNVTQLKY